MENNGRHKRQAKSYGRIAEEQDDDEKHERWRKMTKLSANYARSAR